MKHSTIDTHWVLIADEPGMASAFPQLKEKLAEERLTAITILYCSGSNQFPFRRELSLLEWHFPARLCVIYESFLSDADGSATVTMEAVKTTIETVINANTIPLMSFMISGNPEFTAKCKDILSFLGVQHIDIQEQFFTCQ
ncbi:MAG TPA: hypothetical protein VIM75_08030 [Ohtaekwangia sp.]|uniref:hypothetical protein n=1 Tax=Ohtaekwangia sp. TaxID=2066019 RepID=UPI002F91EC48